MSTTLRFAVAALVILAIRPAHSQTPRHIALRDLVRTVRLSDPQISPDGRSIVVVVTRADTTKDTWNNALVLVDIASGAQRVLTHGRNHVGTPRWSPTGDRLAFTDGVGDEPQVFIMPMAGGDARAITSAPTGVQQYAWRPNGRDIAFVTADLAADTAAHRTGHDAFEISNNDYLTTETPTSAHIWIVSADSGAAKRLTSGSWTLPVSFPPGPPSSPISWSADGRTIAFTKQERPYFGETEKSTLQSLDVETGAIRPITRHTWLESFPQYSPDGAHVAYLYPRDGDIVNVVDAYLTTPDGRAEGTNLTQSIDRMFYRILWMPDSKSFIVGANDVDRVSLWQIPLSGAPRKLVLGDVSPASYFWLDATIGPNGAIAFTGSEPTRPTELYYMASPTSPVQRLTDFNAWTSGLALGRVDTMEWKGPNGFRENAILTFPPDFDPSRKYPVIAYIHGGPEAASLRTYSGLPQVFAAHGYIVFSPNYRGSDNFGNAYMRGVINDAGDGPGKDVMAGLTALEKRPYIDTTRVFVHGTSYGGYMTSWLIGHTTHFKAAVAGAAVTDLADQYNFGDANVSEKYFVGGSPWTVEGEKLLHDQSPIAYVRNVKTPTLVLSTTGDVRVPVTQSYKLFRALTDLGVETKFVAYPVPGHGVGDPVRAIDWYARTIAWIEAHDRRILP